MFQKKLLEWHDENARALLWKGETDPYRIWISEIMLQQTRTETVSGYYHAFLEEFPDVHALAAASEERLFKKWEGLGYYSRARNLHKAAKTIVSEYDGKLPDTAEELVKLPGIGDYTAGAIASIAFERREPAMDGNAVRVISRVFCERGCVGEAKVKRALKEACASLMTGERCGDFNQAMMGLGNMICVPVNPRCDCCPVREFCRARELGVQKELPNLPPKPEKRNLSVGVALVLSGGSILLVKRPEEGLLAGMWAFPSFEGARSEKDVREALLEMGIEAGKGQKIEEAEHVFTHRVWKMKGWRFEAERLPEGERLRSVNRSGLHEIALPTAYRAYRAAADGILARMNGEEREK